jgi:hypothetical protein
MKIETRIQFWVDESISALGYLKPSAASTVCDLISSNQDSRLYRKQGVQLTPDEKRNLGIKNSASMSKAAVSELTAKGLAAPLLAHEATIMRSSFSISRATQLEKDLSHGFSHWECVGHSDCPICKTLDGKKFSIQEIAISGPSKCPRDACTIVYCPITVDQ